MDTERARDRRITGSAQRTPTNTPPVTPSSHPGAAEPSETRTDVLSALDWTSVRCQCARCDCRHAATTVAEVHVVDHCHGPDANPFGNRVHLLCPGCLGGLALHIGAYLRVVEPGASCRTCGSEIRQESDILRAVRELR